MLYTTTELSIFVNLIISSFDKSNTWSGGDSLTDTDYISLEDKYLKGFFDHGWIINNNITITATKLLPIISDFFFIVPLL